MTLKKSINRAKPKEESLSELIRRERGFYTEPYVEPDKRRKSQEEKEFERKYLNLDKYIDTFSNYDLMMYFKRTAEENGFKYLCSLSKDTLIFKRLRKEFSCREICGMIEFLYTSNQNYLNKQKLSPNVLASRWIQSIYSDFLLWVDDKYVPEEKKKKKITGEWHTDNKDSVSKIGVDI